MPLQLSTILDYKFHSVFQSDLTFLIKRQQNVIEYLSKAVNRYLLT